MNTTATATDSPHIIFDMPAIYQLERDYEDTIDCILELLPDVNWNSQLETRQYFLDEFNILLENQRIETLKDLRTKFNDQEEEYELLSGLIELKKVQSIKRNYIDCIIRHSNIDGVVYLREYNGEWVLPNRQPLPYCEAITECIIKTVIPNKGD